MDPGSTVVVGLKFAFIDGAKLPVHVIDLGEQLEMFQVIQVASPHGRGESVAIFDAHARIVLEQELEALQIVALDHAPMQRRSVEAVLGVYVGLVLEQELNHLGLTVVNSSMETCG